MLLQNDLRFSVVFFVRCCKHSTVQRHIVVLKCTNTSRPFVSDSVRFFTLVCVLSGDYLCSSMSDEFLVHCIMLWSMRTLSLRVKWCENFSHFFFFYFGKVFAWSVYLCGLEVFSVDLEIKWSCAVTYWKGIVCYFIAAFLLFYLIWLCCY